MTVNVASRMRYPNVAALCEAFGVEEPGWLLWISLKLFGPITPRPKPRMVR